MTKKELFQRLEDFPDDYEVKVKPNRPSPDYKLPCMTTNIVINVTDYNKTIYLN